MFGKFTCANNGKYTSPIDPMGFEILNDSVDSEIQISSPEDVVHSP